MSGMVMLHVMVEPEWVARLDRIVEAYKRRTPGVRFTRSDAGRAALVVGLAEIERQLGVGEEREAGKGARARQREGR
jgi:hypothetical protein